MNHKIFENITDKQFYVRAFKEYVEDRTRSYEGLMALVNSFLMDMTDPDFIIDDQVIIDYVNNNSEFNVNSYVPFNGGSIPIKGLLAQLAQRYLFSDADLSVYPNQLHVFNLVSETDWSFWTLPFMATKLNQPAVTVLQDADTLEYVEFYNKYFQVVGSSISHSWADGRHTTITTENIYHGLNDLLAAHPHNSSDFDEDISDNEITLISRVDETPITITVESLLSEMQSSLHSVVSWAAAAGAMELDNVSERLSFVRDYVSRTFSNAYDDLSGTLSMVVDVLERATSVSDFFSVFNARNGIDDEELDYSEHDAFAITGSSPMGPLDFGSVAKAAASTLQAGFNLVSGVGKMLFNGAKTVFNFVAKKASEIFVDPFDLETLDGGNTPIVDGFHYQLVNASGNISLPRQFTEYESQVAPWLISRGWVKMDNIFGVILFNIKTADFVEDEINDVLIANITYDLKFAPKPLSTKLFDPLGKSEDMDLITYSQSISDMVSFSERFANASVAYEDTSSHESNLFRGFANSIVTLNALSYWGAQEALGKISGNYVLPGSNLFTLPENITNLDFLKICSGWNGSNFSTVNPYNPGGGVFLRTGSWLTPFLLMAFDRVINPVDYAFLPYTSDDSDLGRPMYRIKTDEENYNAFNTFVTWAIVIAVAAVVAVKLIVAFKKFSTAYAMKTVGMRRKIESDLAAGIPVSPAQMKALKKRNMITNLLGKGSSALVGNGASTDTDLTPVISKIV